MSILVKTAALAISGTLLCMLLRERAGTLALLLAIAVCTVCLGLIAQLLLPIVQVMERAQRLTGITATLYAPLWKCLALAYISRFGADICRDGGQAALAGVVEIAGAVGALYTAIPLFTALFDLLEELL